MWTVMPISELDSVATVWQQIAHRVSASYLLGADFVRPLLRAYGSGAQLIALYEGSNGPEAAGIVTRLKPVVWSTFQPSEACLGLWMQPNDVDSQHLAQGLMCRLPGFPMVMAVTDQDPRLCPRPPDGDHLRTIDYIRTAWVPIAGTFDQYWAERGKNLRNNMRRAHLQLEKSGIRARLETITDSRAVATAIADYCRLETTGWKGKAGTALRPDNAQGRFYREMLERACDRGLGRVYRYVFDDRAVAMDLCVVDDKSLIILKTAYDEAHASVSPASLMREAQCKDLFTAGDLQRIEFYGPLMEWHTRWTAEVVTMYHVNHYRYRLVQRLHEAYNNYRRRRHESTV